MDKGGDGVKKWPIFCGRYKGNTPYDSKGWRKQTLHDNQELFKFN